MKYKMIPAEAKPITGLIVGEGVELPVIELEINRDSKYIVHVDVGNIPPEHVHRILTQTRRTIEPFLGIGRTLFIPCRNNMPMVQVYELESNDE